MLTTVPLKIVYMILAYLDPYNLLQCEQVCRQLKNIITSIEFSKVHPQGILLCKEDQFRYRLEWLRLTSYHHQITDLFDDHEHIDALREYDIKYTDMAWVDLLINSDIPVIFDGDVQFLRRLDKWVCVAAIYIKRTGDVFVPIPLLEYIVNLYSQNLRTPYEELFMNILEACAKIKVPLDIIKKLMDLYESLDPTFEVNLILVTDQVLWTMDLDYIEEMFEYFDLPIDECAVNYVLDISEINNTWTMMNFVISMVDRFGIDYGDVAFMYKQIDNIDPELLRLISDRIPTQFSEEDTIDELELVIKRFVPHLEIRRQLKIVAEAKKLTRILEILEK